MRNSISKKIMAAVLAAALAASMAGCGSSSTSGDSGTEEETRTAADYDTSRSLEELLEEIASELEAYETELTEDFDEMLSGNEETYTDPAVNTAQVAAWHETVMERSEELYALILEDVTTYCIVVGQTMSEEKYYKINNTLEDLAEQAIEGGMYSYEDVICGQGLYNSIYDTYYKELSEEDTDDYAQWNEAYDAFYSCMEDFLDDWQIHLNEISVTYHTFDDDFNDSEFDMDTIFEDLDLRLASVESD